MEDKKKKIEKKQPQKAQKTQKRIRVLLVVSGVRSLCGGENNLKKWIFHFIFAMVRMFGCHRSKKAHIERKKSKINFPLPEEPTAEQIAKIEQTVNEIIKKDYPIEYQFVTKDTIPSGVEIDKLPEDASETIRLVKIGDYDLCCCIGKHVEHTSEIGEFKINSTSYIDGNFRIVFKLIGKIL